MYRELVATVYKKGGTTQNKSFDMTYEELQRELGLGVDCTWIKLFQIDCSIYITIIMNYFKHPEKKHLTKIMTKLDTTCGEQRRELGYGVNSTKSLKKIQQGNRSPSKPLKHGNHWPLKNLF